MAEKVNEMADEEYVNLLTMFAKEAIDRGTLESDIGPMYFARLACELYERGEINREYFIERLLTYLEQAWHVDLA